MMNTEKFHLVNWNTIKDSKENDRLNIKDPTLMNLALGEEIL
jgi:hypothetical protein